jgi:pimeloyl-ACP methyl ester carboxylesterase
VVVGHGFTGSMRRPAVHVIMNSLRAATREHSGYGVVGLDFRGHGGSGGWTTVGDREIYDLDAAVRWARVLGYERVVTVGFSMGGAVAVRHAALIGGIDAVVTMSAPAWWYVRNTRGMRRVHWLIETRSGRVVSQAWRHTRIDRRGWLEQPLAPFEVVGAISPTPLLIVHGTADAFFPVAHGQTLYDCAREPRELWLRKGVGHAEAAADPELLAELAGWIGRAVAPPQTGPDSGRFASGGAHG